jgi:hypothetical protein
MAFGELEGVFQRVRDLNNYDEGTTGHTGTGFGYRRQSARDSGKAFGLRGYNEESTSVS